jgi:hypothetical protein
VLVYPMENETLFVCHIVEWQGCNYTINDDESLNERTQGKFKDETQVEVDASGVGTREAIELGWSWGFRLDELSV